MRRTLAFGAVMMLAGSPALAQSWEISGLAGFTPSAAIDRHAPELDELNMQSGFTWGAQVARFFTPRLGVEALWTEQSSGLEAVTSSGSATLFTSITDQLHGNVIYQLSGIARLEPFVFAGLGSTFFHATHLPSETKLSFDVGGGVKLFPSPTFGMRAHFRYKPTMLDDESSGDFCDPFGFCQETLQQIEIAVGGVVRF